LVLAINVAEDHNRHEAEEKIREIIDEYREERKKVGRA